MNARNFVYSTIFLVLCLFPSGCQTHEDKIGQYISDLNGKELQVHDAIKALLRLGSKAVPPLESAIRSTKPADSHHNLVTTLCLIALDGKPEAISALNRLQSEFPFVKETVEGNEGRSSDDLIIFCRDEKDNRYFDFVTDWGVMQKVATLKPGQAVLGSGRNARVIDIR